MINSKHKLPVSKQCKLLGISRSSFYNPVKTKTPCNELISRIDTFFTKHPHLGSRAMRRQLNDKYKTSYSRYLVRKAMKFMGIESISPKPNTSKPSKEHNIFPYLLRGIKHEVNKVWCSDITYIRVPGGHLFLTVIMDWHSRKILSWNLSNTMDTPLVTVALQEALGRYPKPEIFNTDQGSQYTSHEFTNILKKESIKISMDGKGRWMDNVMVERFWRSLKYENVYPSLYENPKATEKGIRNYIDWYNEKRLHTSLSDRTPNELYFSQINKEGAQAA